MANALLATLVSAGFLAVPSIAVAGYGQTEKFAPAQPTTPQATKHKNPHTTAKYRSGGSGRRRARNTAIGGAGGAAAGALIGGGRGARTGAVVGGAAGALRPTSRRRR